MRVIDPVPLRSDVLAAFFDLIGPDRAAEVRAAAARIVERLDGGTLWHVNSTARGGGVAEMLHLLVPLYRALGVSCRWAVVDGDDRFFDVTKKLGNSAYGSTDPGDRLDAGAVDGYLAHLDDEAGWFAELLGANDVLLPHDHQTAGLVPPLAAKVSAVHWRCHVGVDASTEGSEAAWAVMAPLLDDADGVVFSVAHHVPAELADHHFAVIPPVIWPYAPKNRPLADDAVRDLLDRCGLGPGPVPPYVVADGPRDPGVPLVAQVSRWDRLKDMHGVLMGIAGSASDAHLALVGPDPAAIPDDVDQARWFATCLEARRALPAPVRRRISLVCLPMDDLDDNAHLVNAVQRTADVVVQKSLAEGFGLTVTEAMWKARPVVGSAVGGISAQIDHGRNGLLLSDPHDLAGFADLVTGLTGDAVDGVALGTRAHEDVRRRYLPDGDVLAIAGLLAEEDRT
ncbi:glycosyltransferase [Saccharothrix lopnurensis]|uniref:Glycosyltransferase n=1 Tax=Saccharothrix lopnurensis TaxID=1670621 RepID=A0ABW1NXU3_9PSEU